MTGLEAMTRYRWARDELRLLRAECADLEYRASGVAPRPMTQDGGGRGTGDASMRMLDAAAALMPLREQIAALEPRVERLKAACREVCRQLPEQLRETAWRGLALRQAAAEIAKATGSGEEAAAVLLREAERRCAEISIKIDGEDR